MAKPSEEEIEAWLKQVHEGACCADQDCEDSTNTDPKTSED